jgi:hypothetical protein
VVQVVESLPSNHEVLSSNPSAAKKKKKKAHNKFLSASGVVEGVAVWTPNHYFK